MSWPGYLAGGLMVPTILTQMIPLIRKKPAASPYVYFNSLLINIGYGLLPAITCNQALAYISYACLGIGFFFFIFPFDTCCCRSWFDGWHFAAGELCRSKLSRGEFITALCGNRALPPLITVHAEAYHYETRVRHYTTTNSEGETEHHTETYTEKVTTYYNHKAYKYKSWQEDGNQIRIKETDVCHAVCTVHYRFDDKAVKKLNKLRRKMYKEAKRHDLYADVSHSIETPKFRTSITGYLCQEEPCEIKFYQSCIGRFLWFICSLLGYQSVFEYRWTSTGERMHLRLLKNISGHSDKYRCKFYQEDHDAASSTFRTDGGVYSLNDSLLMSFNPQVIDPLWLQDLPPIEALPPGQQGQAPPPPPPQPQQQGGYPPQQGGYPPQQGGYPPPQQYAPPPGYNAPPPGYAPGYLPQQQGYAPPPQGYAAPPPGSQQPPPKMQ
ncbi:hypothetical protein TVAG_175760 [Trichomonas vaginalis G3]|uniref:XYPPX repeat family protein n=1 Tax=Trichomonas vaginalis (strain ATCC PRA-98 / G3) TaxID=412133 RepID=A2F5P4_TRIV3|nr:transmembrane protein 151-like protein family [Trichomonas vaginalis G3]EAX99807.1 hypothetical protein TVAG_175760 [Trichomonas vaginalis G3]KAI5494441.1 transmembrane protein 151-like protein family [Trichomonas vaginalis G3]|eukprot:XP_001312737.1 hypothetical protein [Trichomonas vaginalis G3]